VTGLREANDQLESKNSQLQGLLEENRELLGSMQRSYLSTITSLARTVEAKDPYTSGHTERVADIALVLAAELGFDESKLPAINVGAIIHDIGKIGVPDTILLKPGPLDPDEFAEMRRHPEMSSYIVGELDLPIEVKQMVRSHHERYDGGGYPDGLAGERIPLAARILTVADALDAMTSDRPYRNALPLEVALSEIRAKSGTQFCPVVVEALERVMTAHDGLRTQFSAPEAVGEDAEDSETSEKLHVSANG
jgi:putative nucleotidyltransferase with HDIG domain